MHYFMPVPIDDALLALFDDAQVEVQFFSKFVKGAKDHFTVTGTDFHASGVLGENRLIVTFAKLDPDADPVCISAFELRLTRAGNWGPIERPELEQRSA